MSSFAGFSESGSMECPPALHCDTFRPEDTGEHRGKNSKHTETRAGTKKQQLTKHVLILDMAIFRSSQNVFFSVFFVVFPVWNTLKHIEIWYRHRWIDLEPKNFYIVDLIWAVSIATGDSNGKMAPKNVVNIWFFMGWSVRFHHQDAVTSTPPFGPTVRFSVIAGFVASSIGPDGVHHPVQSNCDCWGGGLDCCAMISQMRKVSFFFQDPKS